jgi:LmbE family N-acetylglucosaminyl deacetylase
VVYLSPHFDDVALSCGGSAALLKPGEGTCITIFAAPAPTDAELNPYALHLHRRWGQEDRIAANEMRRAEERCATRALGLDLLLMDYADAVYRGDRYSSRAHIFGRVHPDEEAFMAAQLAEDLLRLLKAGGFRRDISLYAPLGIGHHVDHQLTHAATRLLEQDGWDVLYYEDYPYAEQPDTIASRLHELGFEPASPAAGDNRAYWGYQEIDATIERKIEAVACYQSQMTSLFGDETEMRRRVTAYAAQVRQAQREEHIAELYARGMSRHQIDEWLAREDHQRMKRGQAEWRYAERFWRLVEA